jgi:hypothetical protein
MDTAAIVSRNTPDPPAKPVGSSGAPYTPRKLRLKTLNQLDGRTFASRRARELIAAIENDLGGSDAMTEGLRQLVQRAAVLGALIESNETMWLAGDTVDLNTYFMAVNSQRRILTTLGLDRRPRDVTPPLAQYLAERTAVVAEDPADVDVEETPP